eukprot:1080962-Ditylum_brightwellii.AAC.1
MFDKSCNSKTSRYFKVQSKTEQGRANITAEMQAEDIFCKSLAPNVVCLWGRDSGEEPPTNVEQMQSIKLL